MAEEAVAYDKAELRSVIRAFKGMDDEAVSQAKEKSSELADFVRSKIVVAATRRQNKVSPAIAEGSVVSKSSKVGEITFGFARQKFSGGGTTQQLWGGYEFGSNKFKQFPVWSGREGRGSRGWFIYPTLRSIQPEIVRRWEEGFSQVIKRFD